MRSLENYNQRLSADQIKQVAQNADWRGVFAALGLVQSGGKNKPDDWWALSPFIEEKSASFHVDETGCYYCFATGTGGDMVDLVQRHKGYDTPGEAGWWVLDNGLSSLDIPLQPNSAHPAHPARRQKTPVAKPQTAICHEKKKKPNQPIRQNLLPSLEGQGTHPQFTERGIGAATCAYLGCGFLPSAKLKRSDNSMADKVVFQVRGVGEPPGYDTHILTHLGRATTPEQVGSDGKWTFYKGFHKSLELYNLDKMYHDPRAVEQARASGHWLLVEGCFDVAACVQAGVYNVLATFGASLSAEQVAMRLKPLAEWSQIDRCLVWFDRDEAGDRGQRAALQTLLQHDLQGEGFRWDRTFPSPVRGAVKLPDHLNDVGAMTTTQLAWLRGQGVV